MAGLRMIFQQNFNSLRPDLTKFAAMAFYDKYEKDEYYFTPEGYIVFTEKHHLKRGYCCQNNCRHCPWKRRNQDKRNTQDNQGSR